VPIDQDGSRRRLSSDVDVSVQADALHSVSDGLLRGTISARYISCIALPSSPRKRLYRVIRSCLRQGFAPSCAPVPSRTSSLLSMIPMPASRFLRFRILPGLVALALIAVTGACDTAANEPDDTRILNVPDKPTVVTYEFQYDPSRAVDGEVDAVSVNTDNLGSIIGDYGYSRSDVVSATVSEIIVRESVGAQVSVRKLYEYVNQIALYLGNDSTGPVVAEPQNVDPSGVDVLLNAANTDVTSTVRSGSTPAFLVIDVQNTTDTQGFIEAEVRFTIEVAN